MVAYVASGNDLNLSVLVAIGVGVALAVMRIARREALGYVIGGFLGVAVSGFVASRTGKAEDFFLPGLLLNAAYSSAYLISLAVRRPLIGLIAGPLLGEGMEWRQDPARYRAYARATWVWAGLFALRLAVQVPLYLASALVALGIAKTVMGIPLFLVAGWLTYRLVTPGTPAADPASTA